jgi:protein-tyrosine phosphatase
VIDLHCHLLPGVDDGPVTLDESLALATELAADGTRIVVATPHVRPDHPAVVPSELASRASDVRQAIETAGIELEVRPGGELDLSRGLEADDEELQLVSLGQGGAWLLVETPYGPLTSFFERQLFELVLRGYHVLLAHPERNSSFHSNVERLEAIVARGVAVQLTATALLRPPRRSRTGALARTMLGRGLAHVLASDAHGGNIGRGTLSAGLEVARELIGPGADSLVEDAPAAILAGEDPPAPPASATGGRGGGLLRRLRR